MTGPIVPADAGGTGPVDVAWRARFTSVELNALHAQAFGTRVYSEAEWDWWAQVQRHSLGWVVARRGPELAGFVNVLWDGLVHAWLQDTVVDERFRHRGVGRRLVETARDAARTAGCEYLHVDYEPELADFYLRACGFRPVPAGLLQL